MIDRHHACTAGVAVRVASLEPIPDEQKPLLVAAEQYLQLRDESWRIRSKAQDGQREHAETGRYVGGHVTNRIQED